MTKDQLLGLLRKLKAPPHAKATAEAFGVSLRQFQRIVGGHAPVPRTLALLAIAYSKRGNLPNPPWNPDQSIYDVFAGLPGRISPYQPKPDEPPKDDDAKKLEAIVAASAPKIIAQPEPTPAPAPPTKSPDEIRREVAAAKAAREQQRIEIISKRFARQ